MEEWIRDFRSETAPLVPEDHEAWGYLKEDYSVQFEAFDREEEWNFKIAKLWEKGLKNRRLLIYVLKQRARSGDSSD
jgi:hypothetical protein